MAQNVPAPLQARLSRLAARLTIGRRSDAVSEAITLACDLLVAEIATPGVVQVASLTQDAAWRDAGDQIVEMVGGLGFDVHEVEDDSKSWPIILRAFGFWDLPLTDFFGPFLSRLPAWDKQEPLDRTLNLLLDELDHASDPQDREAVVARMRAAVRVALA